MRDLIERLQGGDKGSHEQGNRALNSIDSAIADLSMAGGSLKFSDDNKNKAIGKLLLDYADDLRSGRDKFNKKINSILKKVERA